MQKFQCLANSVKNGFQPFLTFSQPSAVPGVLASGMALLQMAGNHCNQLAHSVGLPGSLPKPQNAKVLPKYPM